MKKKFNSSSSSLKKVKYIVWVVCGVVIVGSLSFAYVRHHPQLFGGNPTSELNDSSSQQEKTIYIAQKDIKAGSIISEADFAVTKSNDTSVAGDAITDIKMVEKSSTTKDISKGETLTMSCFVKETAKKEDKSKEDIEYDERFVEHNFPDGAIPSTLPEGQSMVGTYVDIMLFKQGAEDEVVVSKAKVITQNGNKLGFYLNPTERENLKEAALDSGGFYIITYLDSSQTASAVTYR